MTRLPTLADGVGSVVGFALPTGLHSRIPPAEALDGPQWAAFRRQVGNNNLAAYAVAAMDAGALTLTPDQREELDQVHRFVMLRVLWLEKVLIETSTTLAGAGIDSRVLKGAALAHTSHPDPRLRPYVDVDLLVPDEQFDAACDVLGTGAERVHEEPRRGFVARFGKSAEFRRPDNASIDLHVSLATGVHAIRIRSDDLFVTSTPFTLAGQTLHGLGPAERFLHACYHASVGNRAGKLMPYLDVAHTLVDPNLDEAWVGELRQRWQADAVVAEGVRSAWEVLGIAEEPPLVAWARAHRTTAAETRLLASGLDDGTLQWTDTLAMLRTIRGLRPKVSYLGSLLLPSRDYLAERGQSPRSRIRALRRRLAGRRTTRGRLPRPEAERPERRERRLLVTATEFPPGPGGIGTHAYQLALGATAAGWDVTVLAPQEYVTAREAEAFDVLQPFIVVRFETERSFPTRTWARVRAVVRLMARLDADVVIASGNWAVWLSAVAARFRPRIARVAVGHGMEFGRPTRTRQLLNQLSYVGADVVICVSDYTRERMERSGIRPRRVEVIPNGGDHLRFRPAERSVDPYPDERTAGRPVILSVGNVSLRKGQDVVIRALADLVARGHDVHYVVIGLPTRARDLGDLAAELGVAERVHFRGRVPTDELAWAYQAADLFAMTSREVANGDFEGYGIAVIEAALCGRPAIVTGDSGLEEAVVDGETGLVIPVDDPDAFAEAADKLLSDVDLLASFGQAARRRAMETATWDLRLSEYLRLLDGLAHRPDPRR